MRYCRLIDNELIDVCFPLRGEYDIFTTDAEILREYGYKPVVYEEQPELNKNEYVTPIYTEVETQIIVSWEIHENEISDDPDYVEAAKILLGEEEEDVN